MRTSWRMRVSTWQNSWRRTGGPHTHRSPLLNCLSRSTVSPIKPCNNQFTRQHARPPTRHSVATTQHHRGNMAAPCGQIKRPTSTRPPITVLTDRRLSPVIQTTGTDTTPTPTTPSLTPTPGSTGLLITTHVKFHAQGRTLIIGTGTTIRVAGIMIEIGHRKLTWISVVVASCCHAVVAAVATPGTEKRSTWSVWIAGREKGEIAETDATWPWTGIKSTLQSNNRRALLYDVWNSRYHVLNVLSLHALSHSHPHPQPAGCSGYEERTWEHGRHVRVAWHWEGGLWPCIPPAYRLARVGLCLLGTLCLPQS